MLITSKDDDGTITLSLDLLFCFSILETLSSGLTVLLWNQKKNKQLEGVKLVKIKYAYSFFNCY